MNSDNSNKSACIWLGRRLRLTISDGRIFQGQFVAIDEEMNILIRYCELLDIGIFLALKSYFKMKIIDDLIRPYGIVTFPIKYIRKIELQN